MSLLEAGIDALLRNRTQELANMLFDKTNHSRGRSSQAQEIRLLNASVSGKIRGHVIAPSFNLAMLELVLNAIDAGASRVLVSVDIRSFFLQVSQNRRDERRESLDFLGN